MTGTLREAGCMRKLDHAAIDHVVSVRKEWIGRLHDYYSSNRAITDDVVKNLHNMCDVLINTKRPHKLIIEHGQIRVYTNEPELFTEIIDHVPGLKYPAYTQAVIDRPRDSIRLKESAYSHRTYLRSVVVNDQQKRSISQLLRNQEGIRLSPGLKSWASNTNWRGWTESYYFVDHTDAGWMTMLSLVYPGLIKNTIQIIKHGVQ
jgi:hypothetical protein